MSLLSLVTLNAQAQSDELSEIEAEIDAQYKPDSSPSLSSAPEVEPQVVNSATINVDGVLNEAPVTDAELVQIQSEIKKQKTELVLNKEKTKSFKELSKSVGVLSETTEKMLLEKKAAKDQIAEYNLKVQCLQEEDPDSECDRFVKHKEEKL